jgi:preprotein translocase subunit YajC
VLKNNFHINKIVSILLLGVLFFNLFYFINPQEAKALRENEVQTLFCTGDELKPYTGAGNFHMNDTGCGI